MKVEVYLLLFYIGIVLGSLIFNIPIGLELQIGYVLGFFLCIIYQAKLNSTPKPNRSRR